MPTTHKRILLALYSFVHHSMSRLRVSLPTGPPSSASPKLDPEAEEEDGDGTHEEFALLNTRTMSFAARDKLCLWPVPNLFHGCPSLVRCLFSWKIRHRSDWWFFLCSESTAFNSRAVQDGEKSGQQKNAAKRARAPSRAGVPTLK